MTISPMKLLLFHACEVPVVFLVVGREGPSDPGISELVMSVYGLKDASSMLYQGSYSARSGAGAGETCAVCGSSTFGSSSLGHCKSTADLHNIRSGIRDVF